MAERTPDQIRRETVPAHHNGIIYGFLYGFMGMAFSFSGWAFTHQEQALRYPDYVAHAIKASTGNLSLFGVSANRRPAMSDEQLRYELMRNGNEDHHYDFELLRRGWYPKGVKRPRAWVYNNAALKPVYSDSPMLVFKWPMTLTLFIFVVALSWGLIADYRYQSSIITGVQLEGSVVATVKQYNRVTKGDGMRYALAEWKDR